MVVDLSHGHLESRSISDKDRDKVWSRGVDLAVVETETGTSCSHFLQISIHSVTLTFLVEQHRTGNMKIELWCLFLLLAVVAASASRIGGRTNRLKPKNRLEEFVKANEDAYDICGGDAPVQVFILAGQSNMEGWGHTEHLQMLLANETTSVEYAKFWDDEQDTWASLENVIVDFGELRGPLSVGFGAYPEWFGPELGFGWHMHDHLSSCDKPILLLKVAWGGRDLAIDFRPPSSGIGDYEKDGLGNLYKAAGEGPFSEATYGYQYRGLIKIITDTLNNRLPSIVSGYKAPRKGHPYSLEGLVWFQGWNDVIDEQKANEYEFNLANFVRDVRKDLNARDLPIVIGELGQFGSEEYGFTLPGWPFVRTMQEAQKSITEMDEFKNTTRYVSTGRYLVDDQESWQQLHHYCKSV